MSSHTEPTSTDIADSETMVPDNRDHDSPSESEKPPTSPPLLPPPIDTGLIPWLQVLGSFCMWTNCWGIVNSFGVFQTYYVFVNLSSKSPSQISWIGSIQAFLSVFIGVLSGPLMDKGHFYILNMLGSFFVVFGLMMTSLGEEYWQVMLAQGVVVGLGCGMLFVPSAAIVGQYFVQKRALASSMASIGSGLSESLLSVQPASLAHKIGALNLASIVCACASILTFCWMGVENEPGLLVWAVLSGMFFGAYLGLQPPAFMSVLKGDMRFLASYMGLCLLLASPGHFGWQPDCWRDLEE